MGQALWHFPEVSGCAGVGAPPLLLVRGVCGGVGREALPSLEYLPWSVQHQVLGSMHSQLGGFPQLGASCWQGWRANPQGADPCTTQQPICMLWGVAGTAVVCLACLTGMPGTAPRPPCFRSQPLVWGVAGPPSAGPWTGRVAETQ